MSQLNLEQSDYYQDFAPDMNDLVSLSWYLQNIIVNRFKRIDLDAHCKMRKLLSILSSLNHEEYNLKTLKGVTVNAKIWKDFQVVVVSRWF